MRWFAVAHAVVVSAISLAALFRHEKSKSSPDTRLSFRIATAIGKGEWLYTPAVLISILGAYQNLFSAIGG